MLNRSEANDTATVGRERLHGGRESKRFGSPVTYRGEEERGPGRRILGGKWTKGWPLVRVD